MSPKAHSHWIPRILGGTKDSQNHSEWELHSLKICPWFAFPPDRRNNEWTDVTQLELSPCREQHRRSGVQIKPGLFLTRGIRVHVQMQRQPKRLCILSTSGGIITIWINNKMVESQSQNIPVRLVCKSKSKMFSDFKRQSVVVVIVVTNGISIPKFFREVWRLRERFLKFKSPAEERKKLN